MLKIILIGTWYLKKQKQKIGTTIVEVTEDKNKVTTIKTGSYIHKINYATFISDFTSKN